MTTEDETGVGVREGARTAAVLEEPGEQVEKVPENRGRWVLAATILGSSMAFIDGTVVNVALPALQGSLRATASEMQWVVEAYALLLAALLLAGGALGDRFGRRRLFVIGVMLFALGSVWCGFAGTIHLLIAARALQGVGAALLVPGSLALITAYFREEERGTAIGVWSGFTAMTAAVGPVLGGAVVEHANWRWVFFINVPVALAAMVIAQYRVPESRREGMSEGLDWWGAILATVGLGAVTYALIEGARNPREGWIAGVTGVAALVGFFVAEAKSDAPMVSLNLFRSRTFLGANIVTLFLYCALSGMLYYLPLNLIQVQHYSATAAGAALLPLILMMFVLSRWSGGLTDRYGSRLPLVVGPMVAALGFALGARPGLGGSYWTTVFPAMMVLGLGMSISVAPLTTAVMNAVPQDEAGVASGVNNAVSRLAGLMSVAVFGVVLYARFSQSVDHRLDRLQLPPEVRQQAEEQKPKLVGAVSDDPRVSLAFAEAFISGYRLIVWVSVGLSVASAGTAWFLLEPKRRKRPAD